MNIARTAEAFEAAAALLRCPLCKARLSLVRPGSLLCDTGHCHDLSSRGYASFLSGRRTGGILYDRELFENRTLVMRGGYYDLLTAELCMQSAGANCILDAGCGEGSFTAAVSRCTGARVFGLDNCTQAVRLATGQDCPAVWLAADLANIPLRDGCVDSVLNILAPANYSEFARVLAPDGKIIKVIPGNDYLCQLRRCTAGMLKQTEHDSRAVSEHFARNVRLTGTRIIYATFPLKPGMLDAFVRMTPMLAQIPSRDIQYAGIDEITIHLEVLSGVKRP